MPVARLRPLRRAAVLSAVTALVLSGCGKDTFADKTAKVSVDGRTTTYDIDSCGLDGATAFILGRTTGGVVLQAVVGVEEDGTTGVPASSGLTLVDDDLELAAFGAESWERRGEIGLPPGSVTSARIRGSRIQAAGRLVAVDEQGRPLPASSDAGRPFTFDARCDAAEQ